MPEARPASQRPRRFVRLGRLPPPRRRAGWRRDQACAHRSGRRRDRPARGEAETDPAEAIHEARKDVKKIRSALRLVRDAIGEDAWRRENDHYRDVGQDADGFRDARDPGRGAGRPR